MILKFLTLLNGKISLFDNDKFTVLFDRVKDENFVVPAGKVALHTDFEFSLNANLICDGDLIIL